MRYLSADGLLEQRQPEKEGRWLRRQGGLHPVGTLQHLLRAVQKPAVATKPSRFRLHEPV